ncbi:MAG: DUF3619 family protein [Desulfobulbaceae bacterium]|nr:MAG: DUF3619 family protein [Desulfobulbaceae bacterium]
MSEDNNSFVKKVQKVLAEQNQDIPAATQARLRQSRQQALRSSGTAHRQSRIIGWSLLSASGALAIALLLLIRPPQITPEPVEMVVWQLLLEDDSLHFYQEDLAFYEWVSTVIDQEDGERKHNSDASEPVTTPFADYSGGTGQQNRSTSPAGYRLTGVPGNV